MNTTLDKTEAESKAWYQRAWDMLSEYRDKYYIVIIFHGRRKEYTGIEINTPVDLHLEHIKELLSGMGFMVTGNLNNETITIK